MVVTLVFKFTLDLIFRHWIDRMSGLGIQSEIPVLGRQHAGAVYF